MVQAFEEDSAIITELMHRVKVHILIRRIRCREFFTDFDHLRSGRCSELNFVRAISTMGLDFTGEESRTLADHFTDHGPKVRKPQVVNYMIFCLETDKVFADEEAQDNMKLMMMSSSPGNTVMSVFKPKSPADEEQYHHVLHRLAALCKARGVAIKDLYTDLDRSATPSPSMLNKRRAGKVTRSQFRRIFPFKKEMSEEDMDLICDRYSTKAGDVHFMALHNEVSEVLPSPEQPFPTSPLHLRPDETTWSRMGTSVVRRIQARVVEKRVRLQEHFQDFDALRKGTCSPGQVKTVFTIMNLSKEIDRNDFESLLSQFMQEDGLFNYKAFVAEVDAAFTEPGLELCPLKLIDMPGPHHTLPARRDAMRLSKANLAKSEWLEEKIRAFVRKQGCDLKPMFQDFDRTRNGYISRTQFSRIMSSMGMDLDEKAIGYLCKHFCDLGNHNDFNWRRFLSTVDPTHSDVETAILEMTSPYIAFRPRKYFNDRGRVLSKSMSSPMLLKATC